MSDSERDAVIQIENLTRVYQMGETEVRALAGVSLEVKRNEYIAIMGPSGSGKSTLMNMIGCLDTPSSGEYILNGNRVSQMNDSDLAEVRNREIGFVFQTEKRQCGLKFKLMINNRAACGPPFLLSVFLRYGKKEQTYPQP